MLGGRKWLRKAVLLLALCAGGVGTSAPPQGAPAWTPDPDDQYLLDVTIRQLRLGDGVRAYEAPEGPCVVLGDFLKTLDVPMKIDLAAKKASGWAFKEANRIAIDYGAQTAAYGTRSEAIAPGTIRETPEGWCVQANALSRWFGITVNALTSGSVLLLQSQERLPIELAMERQARAGRLSKAKFDLDGLPQVRIPYRMWRSPALDFVVSAGATYRAKDGVRVDRQSSVYAAGEVAHLSYDAQLSTDAKGVPAAVRLRAYRSDPDGHLLGPLRATHFGFGDVQGFDSRLSGGAASGRGAVVTNRPLTAQTAFDRTHFEGDLPAGWEAEIYRNEELLGFAKSGGDRRYVFDDVQLLYGDNKIRIVLYGPQGQTRVREELINVGQDNAPPGKTWYWAGASQPARDVFALEKPPDRPDLPKAQASVALEHGIDTRTSVAALARAMLIGDQRVTFIEGAVRRSVGLAMVEVSAARESTGGTAARAQILGKVGPVNVNAEAILANDFHLQGGAPKTLREYRLALDAPVKVGRAVLPAHADVHLADHGDGAKQLEAAARLSANFNRFNLATGLRYTRQFAPAGAQPANAELNVMGSGHVGPVRLRGITSFGISPSAGFRSAELEAFWSASEKVSWDGALSYDARSHRGRASLSHIRHLDTMAIALTGEAATDGSVALGINLNFSLDARHGITLSRHQLAQAGEVRAVVFRDQNGNGMRDPDEPPEKGALVTTGTRLAERATGADGTTLVGGLTAYKPIAVGLDLSSLPDPMLVPEKPLQVVVPRPGIPAEVQIALVGGGDIEGSLLKNGGLPFEGVDLELIDGAGKAVATARTDYDGFFLFERVPYGSYAIRVSQASAAAANVVADLGVHVEINGKKSIVRVGAIRTVPQAQIAQAAGSPPSSFR